MNPELNQWLKERANLSATLAAGIVYADGQLFSHAFSRAFGASSPLDKICPPLAEIARNLPNHQLASRRLRWVFQNAFIYGSVRPDSTCAFIITSKALSKEDAQHLDTVLADFQG